MLFSTTSTCLLTLIYLLHHAAIPAAKVKECPDDLELTSSSFQKQVQDSSIPWLVILHNNNGQLAFDVVKSKLNPFGICVGDLDCTAKSNQKLCQSMGIRGFPTTRLFVDEPKINPYTNKKFRNPASFEGNLDMRNLEKFISESLPSQVEVVKTQEEINAIKSKYVNSTFGILFSNKDTVSFLLKTLAFAFEGEFKFLHVVNHKNLLEFKDDEVKNVPSLAIWKDQDKLDLYRDSLKDSAKVISWLNTYAKEPARDFDNQVLNEDVNDQSSLNSQAISLERFQELVSASSPVEDSSWVVLIAASSSFEDKAVAESWKMLTDKVVGFIKSALFICPAGGVSNDNQLLVDLCFQQQSTLFVVPHSDSSRKKVLSNVSKWAFAVSDPKADIAGAIKAASESLPDDLVPTISELDFEVFLNACNAQGVVGAVVLSNKASQPLVLRNVAMSVKGIAKLAFLSQPSPQYLQNIGNPELPTVITLLDNDADAPGSYRVMVYNQHVFGPLSFHSIYNFVANLYVTQQREKGEGEVKSSPVDQTTGEVSLEIKTVNTNENWQSMCSSSYRGFCALTFVTPDNVDSSTNILIELVDAAADSPTVKVPLNFLSIDAACKLQFASAFGVNPAMSPAFVLYIPHKNRYASFVGSYSKNSLLEFIDDVVRGQISTYPIQYRPVIQTSEEVCESNSSDSSTETLGDVSDILEEIRKDEEAKAQAIREEVEKELGSSKKKDSKSKSSKKKSSKKSSKKDEL